MFTRLTGKHFVLSAAKKGRNENIKIITLPLVLYGCETWSLLLTKEHGLKRIFEI
jgi:hypothetical protein